jgi:hypothetical protein
MTFPEFISIVTHQIYICELQKIPMLQTGRELKRGYKGHIDVMKYDVSVSTYEQTYKI